jgi:hypothetical protein
MSSDLAEQFAAVDTVAQMHGMMSKLNTRDPFSYMTLEKLAPTGKAEVGDVYPVGEPETVQPGQKATIHGLEAEAITIKTVPRRWTGGIDYDTWKRGDAKTGGAVSRAIMLSANQIIVDLRRNLTGLLAVGETKTDIFDTTADGGTKSAAFRGGTLANIRSGAAEKKFIPRSGKGFSNLITSQAVGTAGEVRSAFFAALEVMDLAENSIGGYIHVPPPEDGPRFRIIAGPSMRQLVHDAVHIGPGNDQEGLESVGASYEIVQGLPAAAIFVARLDQVYPALVKAVRGPEEFRTTFGENLQKILFDQDLFQPYWAFGYGYGATYNIVKVKA